jgi:hypothetical protein
MVTQFISFQFNSRSKAISINVLLFLSLNLKAEKSEKATVNPGTLQVTNPAQATMLLQEFCKDRESWLE